ncbi:hypothetical protein [Agromyces laixinhei]|uniref:hypothetical protein n=1 Tax=Agromyces laixinhei TaxID=2585717 RepID=UPI0012EE0ABC|nr:hypothetical protein [Agromyces laixinhei]
MDEDEFEQNRQLASDVSSGIPKSDATTDDVAERIHAALAARNSATEADQTRSLDPRRPGQRPGIVWVRASDLLSTGTGRIAGRGLDLEADLVRRLRRAPATTRRAIRERAAKLPPLSEFGRSPEQLQFARAGMGRR